MSARVYNVALQFPDVASRRPRRYSWSLHFSVASPDVLRLSRQARQGHTYAQILAESALERSRAALRGHPHEPLTVAKIAEEDDLSPVAVHSLIKQARVELFGRDLSDSAIYYRLRGRELTRQERLCAQPLCSNQLPRHATARRRYCDVHVTPGARVRRHRAKAGHA